MGDYEAVNIFITITELLYDENEVRIIGGFMIFKGDLDVVDLILRFYAPCCNVHILSSQ